MVEDATGRQGVPTSTKERSSFVVLDAVQRSVTEGLRRCKPKIKPPVDLLCFYS